MFYQNGKLGLQEVANRIIDQELSQPLEVEAVETKNHDIEQKIQLLVPCSGKQRHQLQSKMKKQLKRNLPDDMKTTISCKSTKLSTKFPVKDKTGFQHRHNIVYYGKCPSERFKDDYFGETKRPIVEGIKDHNSRDNSSHLLKHARENNHNYQSNFKQKISESLFIRQLKSRLNVNEKSVMSHLFN